MGVLSANYFFHLGGTQKKFLAPQLHVLTPHPFSNFNGSAQKIRLLKIKIMLGAKDLDMALGVAIIFS